MTEREKIEEEIRHLLATETRTVVLSNELFQQGTGLFSRLGPTEAERRVIVQSELFRTAQARIRELEYRDAESLRETVQTPKEHLPGADLGVTSESTPS